MSASGGPRGKGPEDCKGPGIRRGGCRSAAANKHTKADQRGCVGPAHPEPHAAEGAPRPKRRERAGQEGRGTIVLSSSRKRSAEPRSSKGTGTGLIRGAAAKGGTRLTFQAECLFPITLETYALFLPACEPKRMQMDHLALGNDSSKDAEKRSGGLVNVWAHPDIQCIS